MSKVPLQTRLMHFAMAPVGMPVADVAKMLVEIGNDGESAACHWLDSLLAAGPTNRLMRELEREVGSSSVIRIRPEYVASGRKKRGWKWRDAAFSGHGDELIAIAVIRLLMDDYLDRLHRCQLEDCRRYFVGDPRSRWCSDTCGSRFRVREKRKRDRQ